VVSQTDSMDMDIYRGFGNGAYGLRRRRRVSLSNANLRSSSSNVTQRSAQGLASLIAGH